MDKRKRVAQLEKSQSLRQQRSQADSGAMERILAKLAAIRRNLGASYTVQPITLEQVSEIRAMVQDGVQRRTAAMEAWQ